MNTNLSPIPEAIRRTVRFVAIYGGYSEYSTKVYKALYHGANTLLMLKMAAPWLEQITAPKRFQ